MMSFHWYKYWVVIGFLRKGVEAAAICREGIHVDCPGRPGTAAERDLFHLTRMAIKELKGGIRRAAIKKEGKQQLLSSLFSLLKTYTALTESQGRAFRVAINNVIIRDTEKYCSIHLNEEELLLLWQKVR